MKVNWIKSVAYGIGVASLSAIPQLGYAQSGSYVPPSTWNNFNINPANQSQRPNPVQTDPASPQFRTVSSAVPSSVGQPPQSTSASQQPSYHYAPTQSHYTPTPTRQSYSSPPSLSAPQASNGSPSYTVARRNDSPAMVEGQFNGVAEPLPAGPIAHSTPLVSEQFQGHSHVPTPSPYMEAASAPWEAGSCATGSCGSGMAGGFGDCGPVRPALFPWFGGADVLFWQMANNTNHRLILETGMPRTTLLSSRDVDPGDGIGYDLFFGRYFGCGQYAVSVNYLNFDPGRERAMINTIPANSMVAMPAFAGIGYYATPPGHLDPAAGYTSMLTRFEAMPNFAVERDVSFQGVELNLWSFGFGGARRLAPAHGTGLSCGFHNPFKSGGHGACGPSCAPACPPRYGHGGFGGPLERPCAGSSQLALSQGFRWFQFNDDFRLAGDDGVAQAMFDSNAQNDLFGYQIGGRWNYCLTSRVNIGLGTRFGAYANNVEVSQQVTDSANIVRYESAVPASRRPVIMRDRGTVLSGLGEIDLGAGFRLTDCWTLRGGYRVMGISGVATSVGMIKHEMFSENLVADHEANDSVLLHGAYVGSEFNW